MTLLRVVVRVELAILVACFAAVVGWKLLRSVVRWLRRQETRRTLLGMTGALRLQMLVASLVIAFTYLIGVPKSAAGGRLPPFPEYTLALLAGSQLLFLVALARRLLRPVIISRTQGEK